MSNQTIINAVKLAFHTAYCTKRESLFNIIKATAGNDKNKYDLLETIINRLIVPAHRGQERKGELKNPGNKNENLKYQTHLFMVWYQGYLLNLPFTILITLLLHDIIEDGGINLCMNRKELRQFIIDICNESNFAKQYAAVGHGDFGREVVSRINKLTNKEYLTPEDKLIWQFDHFKDMSYWDQNNKLMDKLVNNWDNVHNPPITWTLEKKLEDINFALKLFNIAKHPPAYIGIMLSELKEKLNYFQ